MTRDTQDMNGRSLLYPLSIPERAVRSLSALGGGFFRELSLLALPEDIRNAALYRATAGVTLRFFIEQVGEVPGIYPKSDPIARQFVYRYATGTSIEWLSIATFFVSPVWVLAALGDATRAGKTLISRIADALKAEGLLDPAARYETMEQLLDGIERTSTHLALTVNMPPLDVAGLRREWEQFRRNVAPLPAEQLPAASEVESAWNDLSSTAQSVNQSVFQVSEAIGQSAASSLPRQIQRLSRSAGVAARTAGTVVGRPFLEHYAAASKELRYTGFAEYWARHTRPYWKAAIRNFRPEKRTWLERTIAG